MTAVGAALEFTVGTDVVRGVGFAGSGRGTLLFVHDLGSDLDQFGALPEALAAAGFDAVAVDLPGHGLSGGDELTVDRCAATVRDLVAAVAAASGVRVVGLVTVGRVGTVASALGRDQGVATHLVINPVLDADIAAGAKRVHAVRLVVHGDGPNIVGTETQRYFSYLIGEKLLMFNAALAAGPAVVATSPTVAAHVELFFKRYLQ